MIETTEPLRLVDLTGPGLPRLGADARLADGDHQVSQAWSAAFHGHPDRPDGILYRARHDPSRFAVAIFERAQRKIVLRVFLGERLFLRGEPEPLLGEHLRLELLRALYDCGIGFEG